MKWQVEFHDDFRNGEWRDMDKEQRKALVAAASALEEIGPSGGRPLIDTLKNSKHRNMKELRYDAHEGREVWRAAFAFDPDRRAVVLVAGDKQGMDEKLFYGRLIEKADGRFDRHLAETKALEAERTKQLPHEKPRSGKRNKR
jgi:hypothetical protein